MGTTDDAHELGFGNVLRSLRRTVGLTQEELAERARLSVRGLSDLERGVIRTPRRETALALAEALELSHEERASLLAAARRHSPAPPVIAAAPTDVPDSAAPAVTAAPAPTSAATPGTATTPAIQTFLIADVRGYTRYSNEHGDEAAARLAVRFAELAREVVVAHSGQVLELRGDEALAAFASAHRALHAAAALQARFAAETAAHPELPLRAGIGLDAGKAVPVAGGYRGLALNLAARLCALAAPGEVLASDKVVHLARKVEEVVYQPRRSATLKGFTALIQVVQVLPDGEPATAEAATEAVAPRSEDALATETAEKVAWIGQSPGAAIDKSGGALSLRSPYSGPAHNLPAQPAPLLGREREVASACSLLRREDVRLVTLTGPGGVGKTRLALRVAAELANESTEAVGLDDGVWLVRLARLRDPGLVVPTIAQTLGLREAGGRLLTDVLREHLRPRRLLLLLDNFEHLLAAAPEVAVLLEDSPGLKVLATSRERLRLSGEVEHAVPPLALPDLGRRLMPERISQHAAVRLFVERAAAVQAGFRVTEGNAPAIAEICARLDGLPLAIELAAARIKVLPPEALLARLSSRLKLLTGGPRDAEAHQQTMRATIAWSDALLSPEERILFRRLAVFVGGCTLEAAEAVCGAPEGAASLGFDLLDGLATLVDQSLVQHREEGGEPRFGMLHVIREYALERLEESGEAEALCRAHVGCYLMLAEEVEPWLLGGPRLPEALVQLEREHDNLRAALTWTRQQQEVARGLRLAGAVSRFWFLRGHLSEGREWLDRLLALEAADQEAVDETPRGVGQPTSADEAAPAGVRAKALFGAGELASYQYDFSRAVPLLEQSLTLARAAEEKALTALVLNRLGDSAERQGDLGRATAWLEESLALARELGDPLLICFPLHNLALVAYYQGDLPRAEAHIAAVVAMDRQTGELLYLPYDLVFWAHIRRRQGDLPQSFRLLREAFTILRDVVERASPLLAYVPWQLMVLAGTLAEAGRGEQAARFFGAATALWATIDYPWSALEQADLEAAVAPARAALGEEAWAAAYEAGRALSLEEAVAKALDEGVRAENVEPAPGQPAAQPAGDEEGAS
jgi:non-specific serine/threonine protein kinase